MSIPAPRWDLTNVYPSLESAEFKAAYSSFKSKVADLGDYFVEVVSKADAKTPPDQLGPIVGEVVERFNDVYTLSSTLEPYIYSFVSTDSHNKTAMRTLSEYEQASLPLQNLNVQLKAWLGKIAPALEASLEHSAPAKDHAFMLKEAAEQSKYLMSEAEEALAAELSLSGGNAWSKLQGTVTSQLSVDFELDGETQKLPMPALINLRSHPDEATRQRAYEAENTAWDSVRETLAAVLRTTRCNSHILTFAYDGTCATVKAHYRLEHRETGVVLEGTYRQVVYFARGLISRLEEYHDAGRLTAFWQLTSDGATPKVAVWDAEHPAKAEPL